MSLDFLDQYQVRMGLCCGRLIVFSADGKGERRLSGGAANDIFLAGTRLECEGRVALLIPLPPSPPFPPSLHPLCRSSPIERSMVYVYMFTLYNFSLYYVGRWPCVRACVRA